MSYEDILKKDVVKLKDFNTYFKPLDEPEKDKGYTWQFEDGTDAKAQAELLDKEHSYRHIWTVVDGDSGDAIILNGWHACNRLFYIVCEIPWGDGTPADSDVYIEAEY